MQPDKDNGNLEVEETFPKIKVIELKNKKKFEKQVNMLLKEGWQYCTAEIEISSFSGPIYSMILYKEC